MDQERDANVSGQVEQQLLQSELRYRMLFESASDAILMMHADHFIECNSSALRMYGCESNQIIGESPDVFSPEFQPDGRPSKVAAQEKINLAL